MYVGVPPPPPLETPVADRPTCIPGSGSTKGERSRQGQNVILCFSPIFEFPQNSEYFEHGHMG